MARFSNVIDVCSLGFANGPDPRLDGMSVKNRDLIAGWIMRAVQDELDPHEVSFYRTPSAWEKQARGVIVYVTLEEYPVEYIGISATDAELREKPYSTIGPRAVDVCRQLRRAAGLDADPVAPSPRKKKAAPKPKA